MINQVLAPLPASHWAETGLTAELDEKPNQFDSFNIIGRLGWVSEQREEGVGDETLDDHLSLF